MSSADNQRMITYSFSFACCFTIKRKIWRKKNKQNTITADAFSGQSADDNLHLVFCLLFYHKTKNLTKKTNKKQSQRMSSADNQRMITYSFSFAYCFTIKRKIWRKKNKQKTITADAFSGQSADDNLQLVFCLLFYHKTKNLTKKTNKKQSQRMSSADNQRMITYSFSFAHCFTIKRKIWRKKNKQKTITADAFSGKSADGNLQLVFCLLFYHKTKNLIKKTIYPHKILRRGGGEINARIASHSTGLKMDSIGIKME